MHVQYLRSSNTYHLYYLFHCVLLRELSSALHP